MAATDDFEKFNIFGTLPRFTVNSPNEVFNLFINLFLYIATVSAIVVIVSAGITYISAGGDDEKTTKAKLMITYAIVGLVVIALMYVMVGAVINAAQGI